MQTATGRITFFDTRSISHLTFAVLLKDDFSGHRPTGTLRVSIKELEYIPILNRSGYYLFLDIDDKLEDNHTLLVESEEEYYFKKSILIGEIKQQQDLTINPAVEVSLIPNASHPFHAGISLVRGTVLTEEVDEENEAIKKPVPNAEVELKAKNLIYTTEDNGDFIFYFKGLKESDVVEKDGRSFIKMNSDTETDLVVRCDGYNEFKKTDCEVEVGKTAVFSVLLVKEI